MPERNRDTRWCVNCDIWGVSLGLNNLPRIDFALVKSRIEKIRRLEQGDCRSRMAVTGFHYFVANRAQMWYRYREPWHTGTAVFRPQIAKRKIIVPRFATLK
jgi:hypothetical protein